MDAFFDQGGDDAAEGEQRLVDLARLPRSNLGFVRARAPDVLGPGEIHQVQLPHDREVLSLLARRLGADGEREDGVRAAGVRVAEVSAVRLRPTPRARRAKISPGVRASASSRFRTETPPRPSSMSAWCAERDAPWDAGANELLTDDWAAVSSDGPPPVARFPASGLLG